MVRKSTEQLMLEVHSRLNNAEVALMKQQVIDELGELSKEAVMEIIAKNIGIEMEERTKMANEKEIKGIIEDKTMKVGAKDGKPWKRFTYKVGGLTLASFTEFDFTLGQNVKVVYVDNESGSNIYHNIQNMELEASSVVKEEFVSADKIVPQETKPVQVEKPVFNNSMITSYIEANDGMTLSNLMNDFGKTHSVHASQTHVFGSYNDKAEPVNKFCAWVWWR